MRVAVTGGAGFLGSHVADVLAESGHDVTVVDLNALQGQRSVIADLGDLDALARALAGQEAVCHLAAVGDIYLAEKRPALAAHVNVTGTANLCEAAVRAGTGALIYASTWEVYGAPRYQPIDEFHPTTPSHPYAVTKLAGERLALAYGRMWNGLRTVALRLGTAYGTRMRPNSVFSIFVDRARRGEPLVLQGGGEQSRQFTHARDIGRAFRLALERAKNGSVYNIVADDPVTIRQLAEEIVKWIPARIEEGPARPHDVPVALVSSALARVELDWRADVKFSEGIGDLVTDAVMPLRS
jgi:UDP-glucose 4-epimerase